MTAREYARLKGYTLLEIADRLSMPSRTLSRWYKTKPYVFEQLVDGMHACDFLKGYTAGPINKGI